MPELILDRVTKQFKNKIAVDKVSLRLKSGVDVYKRQTVLLVEQNAKKALGIADRAYVLETGNIVLTGEAKALMNDESIKKAYLGE